MDINCFFSQMKFTEQDLQKVLPSVWEKLASHASDTLPEYMTAGFYEKYYPMTKGPSGIPERMREVETILRSNPAACLYADMLHYGYFLAPHNSVRLDGLPLPEKIFGENTGIFSLMVGLSHLALTAKTYAKLNIPESYLEDLATWFKGAIEIYQAAHDRIPGFTLSQMGWLRLAVDGRLFRIGRLEYLLHSYPEGMPAVYRNREDHSIAVLCRDGWMFNRCGYRVFQADRAVFTARLKELNGKVTGTPVTPSGEIMQGKKFSLDLRQWEPCCSPWELVPSLHIPGGFKLEQEDVRDSLLKAKAFFHQYFAADIKAFYCSSWILNPQWEEYLPDSNMAKFRRNGYAGATEFRDNIDGLFFIFGHADGDFAEYPRSNTIQKALHKAVEEGNGLASGSVFFLTSDLEHYGSQYYRKNTTLI